MDGKRMQDAQILLAEIEKSGSLMSLKNGWLNFEPTPSTDLMMKALPFSNEFAEIAVEREKAKNMEKQPSASDYEAKYKFVLGVLLEQGILYKHDQYWHLKGNYGCHETGLNGLGACPEDAILNAMSQSANH